jgi:hypothetical protein
MRSIKRIALVVLLVAACLWSALQLYARHSQKRIESTVRAVQELPLKQTTMADATAQLDSLIGKRGVSRSGSDGGTEAEYTIVAPQGGLKGLGHVFWFSVTLSFDSASRLTSKRLLLTSNATQCCSAEVWELSSSQGESPSDDFRVARYDPYRIIVHVGTGALAEERSAAWDWQLSCLTSLSGCRDVRRILPSVHPVRHS